MNRIWLDAYPAGVPHEIDPDSVPSLTALLDDAYRTFAERPALTCMGKTLRYADLDRMSRALACWLQQSDLPPRSRIAVMLPNILQYPVTVAAILRAGHTVVNVNPLYTPRELRHQLNDAGAEAIIVLENFAATVEDVLPRTPIRHVLVTGLGDLLGPIRGPLVNLAVRHLRKMVPRWQIPEAIPFRTALEEGARHTLQPVETTREDIAFLQYTGGTTGLAKGAILTHRNIIANILQNEAWARPALEDTPEQIAIVCALPLYHILALTACMMVGTRWGARNVLIPNPRDIKGLIGTLRRNPCHFFPGVNTLYNALLNAPGFDKLDFSRLRVTLGGGMPVQRAVSERWQAVTGCTILEGYGLSETSPCATLNPPGITTFSGTIGIPIPSTDVAILDDAGQQLDPGTPGEIAVRGPQVMRGYWNQAEETAKVMTPDGFFRTGDIGIMDAQGFFRIVDRKKDMILVSGFNVYPAEIEDVVATHPDVLECACIGMPDPHSGEAVKLYVVPRNAALTPDMLMQYCRAQLTGYKRPRQIVLCTQLPKSNVGKILRRELKEQDQLAGRASQ